MGARKYFDRSSCKTEQPRAAESAAGGGVARTMERGACGASGGAELRLTAIAQQGVGPAGALVGRHFCGSVFVFRISLVT